MNKLVETSLVSVCKLVKLQKLCRLTSCYPSKEEIIIWDVCVPSKVETHRCAVNPHDEDK